MGIALRLAAEGKDAAGTRLFIFASIATIRGITGRPNEAQRHANMQEGSQPR